jgi:hypothetical protein
VNRAMVYISIIVWKSTVFCFVSCTSNTLYYAIFQNVLATVPCVISMQLARRCALHAMLVMLNL